MTGLTDIEVLEQISANNVNIINNKTTKTIRQILFDNSFTLFNIVNVSIFALLVLVSSFRNILFMGVVISNAIIGIISEIRAKIIIDKLAILNSTKISVLRNGIYKSIDTSEIVLFDVVKIVAGEQIPVDGIILNTDYLEVNESLITGESEPVFKKNSDNVYSGSYVISGNAHIKATAVGNSSFSGKLTFDAKKKKKRSSEIFNSLLKIIKVLSYIIAPLGALLFISQYFILGNSFEISVVGMAGGVVGIIPSGLVLLISLAFTFSVIKLSRYKALISDNFAIEQLARVNTICFDKTGTITLGKLKVNNVIYCGDKSFIDKSISEFLAINNDSNSTYAALLNHFGASEVVRECNRIPFSSDRKFSAILNQDVKGYILGAPDSISNHIDDEIANFQNIGFRIIAFAEFSGDIKNVKLNSNILAYIIISDEIREEISSVFKYFEFQGVDIKIISGDNEKTIVSTARAAGLLNISVIDMSSIDDGDYTDIVLNYNIFARVSPQQKKKLIIALKKVGKTVAMIGDGINDISALRESDCSITVSNGCEAIKGISNIVLLESDFSLLPSIINEGRGLINNLSKVASLYLNKTIYTIFLILFFIISRFYFPFQPIHFTLIGALFIGIPSFFLAIHPSTQIVKKGFIKKVLGYSVPFGSLTAINVVFIQLLIYFNLLTAQQGLFVSVALIASLSFLLLCILSSPFNKTKILMLFLLGIAFCILINFKMIFAVPSADLITLLFVVTLTFISLFLLKFILKFTVK